MKRFILILLILSSINVNAASKLEKGFKALQESNYTEAHSLFNEVLIKTPSDAGANYGLSLTHYKLMKSNSNKDENFQPSYKYLLAAYATIDQVEKKEQETYSKLGITKDNMLKHKETLEGISFEVVRNSTNSDIAQGFIELYKQEPLTKYYFEAKEIYEKNMFYSAAKRESIQSYKVYIRDFPNSKYAPVAKRGIDSLSFVSYKNMNNADSIKSFIDKNPSSSFISQAKEQLEYQVYTDYTKNNTKVGYEKYIKDYPSSAYVPFAKKTIMQLETVTTYPFFFFSSYPSQPNQTNFVSFKDIRKVTYEKEKNDLKAVVRTYQYDLANSDRKERGLSGSQEIFSLVGNKFIVMNGDESFTMIQMRLSSHNREHYYFFENYRVDKFKNVVKEEHKNGSGTDVEYYAELNKESGYKHRTNDLLFPHPVSKNDPGEMGYKLKSAIRLKNKHLCLLFQISTTSNQKLPFLQNVYGMTEFEIGEQDKLDHFQTYYKIVIMTANGEAIYFQKFFHGSMVSLYPSSDGGFYVLQDKATKLNTVEGIFSMIDIKGPDNYKLSPDLEISPDGINLLKFDHKLELVNTNNYYIQTDKGLQKDIPKSICEDDKYVYLQTYSFKNGVINYPSLCIYKSPKTEINTFTTYTTTEDYVFDKYYKYSIYNAADKQPDQILSLNNTLYVKYNGLAGYIAKTELNNGAVTLSPAYYPRFRTNSINYNPKTTVVNDHNVLE